MRIPFLNSLFSRKADLPNQTSIFSDHCIILLATEGGEGVIVFPEGTSTKGETVLPFNSSFLEFAAQRDLPVSYASITYKVPNDSPKAADTVCWWDEKTFAEHLWQLFQVKNFTAVITFGSDSIQNPNRKELAKTLWTKVNENFIQVV